MTKYLAARGKSGKTPGGGVVQELARGLLASNLVAGVVCYVQGHDAKDIRPALIVEPEEAGRITVSAYKPYGLGGFIKKYVTGKICLVGHTCDIRAAIELAKRNQLDLADIYTIGIACTEPKESLSGEKRSNCLRCEHLVPAMADLSCIVTEKATMVEVASQKGEQALAAAQFDEVAQPGVGCDFEALKTAALERQKEDFAVKELHPRQKLSYWLSQFGRCLKCYGCRNSCPICYCKECVLEGDRGVVPGGQVAPAILFHLTRLAHVADSCLNCGQCDSACPVDIPISKLYHMLHKDLCAIFGHESGMDLNAPPLAFFAPEERTDMATVLERR